MHSLWGYPIHFLWVMLDVFLVEDLSDDGLVVLDVIEGISQHVADDGLSCIQSVLCLLYIVCVWTFVNIVCNFVDAWQRMENLHVLAGLYEHVVLEDIYVLHPLVFHEVGEASCR